MKFLYDIIFIEDNDEKISKSVSEEFPVPLSINETILLSDRLYDITDILHAPYDKRLGYYTVSQVYVVTSKRIRGV